MRYAHRRRQLPRHDIPTPGSSGKAPRLAVRLMLATSGGRADLRFRPLAIAVRPVHRRLLERSIS